MFFSTGNTGGSTLYNWSNDETDIGLVASGIGNILSFAATNTGTAPLVANITVTPEYTNDGVTCTGSPETFTITVNPTAQVEDITSEVVCNGDLTTEVNFSTLNTIGTTTYSWTNNATSIGLAAMGSGDIAEFTAVNNGTAPVIATITVTPQFTNDGVTCSGPSKNFTITVNPTAQVNDPADLIVCNAQSTSVTFVTNRTGGATTFNWTNDVTGIGLPATGSGDI
ncbi:MAG: hypothetical protein J0653_01220, partial [Deltaproteobacteria bacterium]|nr:hypothetical protein [Deltaproteobacteria bacterium]